MLRREIFHRILLWLHGYYLVEQTLITEVAHPMAELHCIGPYSCRFLRVLTIYWTDQISMCTWKTSMAEIAAIQQRVCLILFRDKSSSFICFSNAM